MVSRIFTKLAEDAAIAIGGAIIATAVKHVGPTLEKNAPGVLEAAKDKASDAVDAAKVVGKAATRKFRK